MISGLNSDIAKESYTGLLFFLAGSIILMGIITAEIYYPHGYTTANSEISDLGATRPPNSVIYQPSALIFNWTMIVSGLFIITGSILLFLKKRKWILIFFPLLLGIGVLGVGIFPGNNSNIHPIFALIAFIAGGLSAILSWKMTVGPLKWVFALLGLITLFFLFFSSLIIPILGDGGTERFIAYPVIIWLIGFGGFLAGNKK